MALRKKIVKLAKMIGGLVGVVNKIDENAPEYYGLECVVTDEMADVALCAGLRKPRTIEYLAEKSGKSLEETKRLADELANIGVFKLCQKEGDTKPTYMVEIFAPGILEYMVNNTTLPEQYPAIGRAFEEYTRIRIQPMAPILPVGKGLVRVIPYKASLGENEKLHDYESLEYYLNRNDKFAVASCTCRKTRRQMGEGCGHLEEDICLMLGETADYYIRTGKGRGVTREEARDLLKRAEENGLVHEIPNIDGNDNTPAICNCCSCSCFAMRVATMMKAPDVIRSNFRAHVNPENCVACGQCVETCPTNALRLGQKLCSTKPVVTGEQLTKEEVTPRNTVWGEERWNKDYRINRENVVETGTAPCKTACPAHIGVQGYIKLAAQGKYREALELIKKENPFPAVCGRICPHKCEDACTRAGIDEPIAIDEIKKFIADQELKAENRFVPEKKFHWHRGNKVAVVGAGPAGLSCAYYLALYNYNVTVFEKEDKLGGMLTYGIPEFRLQRDVIEAEIDVLKQLGVEFKTGVEVGKDITITELKKQGFDGFYLAIGAQAGRKLNIEGEDAENVIAGVDFLRNVNRDKDSAKLSGNVIVIGGGNVAIDVARTAVREGAATVNMYSLESRAEMPALEEEIREAEEEKVAINNGYGPKRIIVENGKVTGVEFKKCISVFDANHKFAPKYDENDVITVKADYVLVSVGQSIVWGDLLKDTGVKLNKNGTAIADEFTFATDDSKIAVGGDCFTGPNFAINAIAAGKQGAVSLHRMIQPGQSLVYGRDRRDYKELDKDSAIIKGYDETPRQRPIVKPSKEFLFEDTRQTFTEDQMKKEASRCLGCGAVQVNAEMCIGCGICTSRCKFDAIKLERHDNEDGINYEKLPLKVAPYVVKRMGNIVKKSITKK